MIPSLIITCLILVDYWKILKKEVLTRITTKSPEVIKPYLDAILKRLVQLQQVQLPLYETASPEELAQAFYLWAASHEYHSPLLSNYAVSRKSMYSDKES